jgi:hypothetical protein
MSLLNINKETMPRLKRPFDVIVSSVQPEAAPKNWMARIRRRLLIAGFALTVWWLLVRVAVARAQISYDNGQDTVFVHSQTSQFWISGQGNSIFQWHPRFSAHYSGPNSFEHASEQASFATLNDDVIRHDLASLAPEC